MPSLATEVEQVIRATSVKVTDDIIGVDLEDGRTLTASHTTEPKAVLTAGGRGTGTEAWAAVWDKDGKTLDANFIYLTFMAPIGPILEQQLKAAGFNATAKLDDKQFVSGFGSNGTSMSER